MRKRLRSLRGLKHCFFFCDEPCSPFSFGWQLFRAQAEAKRAERETLMKKISPDQRAAFLAQEDEVGDPSSRPKLLHVFSLCVSRGYALGRLAIMPPSVSGALGEEARRAKEPARAARFGPLSLRERPSRRPGRPAKATIRK
jgi:hypothetical protein